MNIIEIEEEKRRLKDEKNKGGTVEEVNEEDAEDELLKKDSQNAVLTEAVAANWPSSPDRLLLIMSNIEVM